MLKNDLLPEMKEERAAKIPSRTNRKPLPSTKTKMEAEAPWFFLLHHGQALELG